MQGSAPPDPRRPPEPSPIRFGTDGWRGRIAEEITLAGIRRCAAGISAYLREAGKGGTPSRWDTTGGFSPAGSRRRSPPSCRGRVFVPILSPEPVPTPALSFRVASAGRLPRRDDHRPATIRPSTAG